MYLCTLSAASNKLKPDVETLDTWQIQIYEADTRRDKRYRKGVDINSEKHGSCSNFSPPGDHTLIRAVAAGLFSMNQISIDRELIQ